MALSFTNTAGNLFNRWGRFGKLQDKGRIFQGDLSTYFGQLLAQYDSSVASPLQAAVDGVPTIRDSAMEGAVSAYMDSLRMAAQNTVLLMVKADKPTSADTLQAALYEVYLQMVAAGASIKKCTVTATSAAAGTNSGNGVCVVTAKRGDGRDQELLIPEAAYIRCIADSQSGGATVGQEQFNYLGEVASRGVWSPDYPIGPGLQSSATAIDTNDPGTAGRIYGNVVVNGNFEAFTTNLPNSWVAEVGAAGTDFQKSTTTVYSGTSSLQFIGGATNTVLSQTFNLASGSPVVLLPQTGYALNFFARMDVAPAAGVLTVELTDGSGAVINDDQGVANSFTVNLVTLGTSFVSQTAVFRLPKLIPSTVKLRYRMSTALSAGKNLFVDGLAMGRVSPTYNGGPGFAVFSGSTKFVSTDYFTMTSTNDFGGSSNLSTFQWLLDRLFFLRDIGILFPSNSSPTIADTLITA